ncbi:unnamed protein product [Colias eurytheme]|nr:unnamed protein product [Colias eurytheme]
MFRLLCFCAFLAFCHGYAIPVAPLHTVAAPIPVPYLNHAYGYGGHGLGHGFGHGFAKPLGHHILKRSPHFVEPLAHVGHLAPVATHLTGLAPLAVSHQERVDVHSAPAIISSIVPIVKEVVAPVLAAPILHKPFGHYGAGAYGSFHPHVGHY